MNPSVAMHFEGPVGALIVSVIALTIVFAVLAGLTAVIYAIKIFSGGAAKPVPPSSGTPAAPTAPVASASAPSAVQACAVPNAPKDNQGRITAVITAAILAATQGRGVILSVVPEKAVLTEWTRTWALTGRIERLGSRLVRTWKH